MAGAINGQAMVARTPHTFETASGPVKITPIFHASTLIEADGKAIYLDPWSQGDFTGLPPADLILITHAHADHMDPAAVEKISRSGTEIWSPKIVAQTITSAEVISNGEIKKWNGWTIEAVPAYNILNGNRHQKGIDNGYILTYGGKRFYFSGDTEGTPEMRALKNIDVAFVCMNAPTMKPEEAADAVKSFHPKMVIPYHYRDSDLGVFKRGLEGTGIEILILDYYPKSSGSN
jgi:L-ascorbate metabolism protein UlaG (beta-lactamase superfamily)